MKSDKIEWQVGQGIAIRRYEIEDEIVSFRTIGAIVTISSVDSNSEVKRIGYVLSRWESETSFATRGHKSAEQKKTRYRPVYVPLHRSPTTTRETRYSVSRYYTAKLPSILLRIRLGKFSVRLVSAEWDNRLVKIYI